MGWQITFGGTLRTDRTPEEIADPYSSKWEGGTVVPLDQLSPATYDELAAQDSENTWWGVYRLPTQGGERMYRVASAAAKFAGIDAPEKPSNMIDAEKLLDQFEQTQDISSRPVVDGFPPEPSEMETGSSSGQSDVSDGSPVSPDENQ